MAIGHAVRGASAAALTLIVIEAVGSDHTGKVGSFFADVSRLLQRAISPDVPLIPDRSGGKAPEASSYLTPEQAAAAAAAANGAAAAGAVTAPGGLLDGMPSLGQYVAGGGLPGLTGTGTVTGTLHPANRAG